MTFRRFALPVVMVALVGSAVTAVAQESFVPDGSPLPPDALALQRDSVRDIGAFQPIYNGLPNILITGYWPPTNEMLRPWSTDLVQNPGGWVGENWEGRGFNIYAFFPEFPSGAGKGVGDFEVDYQDTSADWWILLPKVRPIAIITFSRGGTSHAWELEGGNRTYVANSWTSDYLAPTKPTPELPIMQLEPPGTERYSTLPIADIITEVGLSGANVTPVSSVIDNGAFLSNFIGYHGCWYRFMHQDPTDPSWCVAAGHIHVGASVTVSDGTIAAAASLRVLTDHVYDIVPLTGDMNCDNRVDFKDINLFVEALGCQSDPACWQHDCRYWNADCNLDAAVDFKDINAFVARIGNTKP